MWWLAVAETEPFGRRKELAISALLANSTITRAAAQAGISERTIRRWMRDPVFVRRYREERTRTLEATTNLLRKESVRAVRTLASIAGNSRAPVTARVSAARAIVELTFKGVELHDLEERIGQLEEIANGVRGNLQHERPSQSQAA